MGKPIHAYHRAHGSFQTDPENYLHLGDDFNHKISFEHGEIDSQLKRFSVIIKKTTTCGIVHLTREYSRGLDRCIDANKYSNYVKFDIVRISDDDFEIVEVTLYDNIENAHILYNKERPKEENGSMPNIKLIIRKSDLGGGLIETTTPKNEGGRYCLYRKQDQWHGLGDRDEEPSNAQKIQTTYGRYQKREITVEEYNRELKKINEEKGDDILQLYSEKGPSLLKKVIQMLDWKIKNPERRVNIWEGGASKEGTISLPSINSEQYPIVNSDDLGHIPSASIVDLDEIILMSEDISNDFDVTLYLSSCLVFDEDTHLMPYKFPMWTQVNLDDILNNIKGVEIEGCKLQLEHYKEQLVGLNLFIKRLNGIKLEIKKMLDKYNKLKTISKFDIHEGSAEDQESIKNYSEFILYVQYFNKMNNKVYSDFTDINIIREQNIMVLNEYKKKLQEVKSISDIEKRKSEWAKEREYTESIKMKNTLNKVIFDMIKEVGKTLRIQINTIKDKHPLVIARYKEDLQNIKKVFANKDDLKKKNHNYMLKHNKYEEGIQFYQTFEKLFDKFIIKKNIEWMEEIQTHYINEAVYTKIYENELERIYDKINKLKDESGGIEHLDTYLKERSLFGHFTLKKLDDGEVVYTVKASIAREIDPGNIYGGELLIKPDPVPDEIIYKNSIIEDDERGFLSLDFESIKANLIQEINEVVINVEDSIKEKNKKEINKKREKEDSDAPVSNKPKRFKSGGGIKRKNKRKLTKNRRKKKVMPKQKGGFFRKLDPEYIRNWENIHEERMDCCPCTFSLLGLNEEDSRFLVGFYGKTGMYPQEIMNEGTHRFKNYSFRFKYTEILVRLLDYIDILLYPTWKDIVEHGELPEDKKIDLFEKAFEIYKKEIYKLLNEIPDGYGVVGKIHYKDKIISHCVVFAKMYNQLVLFDGQNKSSIIGIEKITRYLIINKVIGIGYLIGTGKGLSNSVGSPWVDLYSGNEWPTYSEPSKQVPSYKSNKYGPSLFTEYPIDKEAHI